MDERRVAGIVWGFVIRLITSALADVWTSRRWATRVRPFHVTSAPVPSCLGTLRALSTDMRPWPM